MTDDEQAKPPNEPPTDPSPDARNIRAKFEQGEREIRDGRGVPHAIARRQFEKWLTK